MRLRMLFSVLHPALENSSLLTFTLVALHFPCCSQTRLLAYRVQLSLTFWVEYVSCEKFNFLQNKEYFLPNTGMIERFLSTCTLSTINYTTHEAKTKF